MKNILITGGAGFIGTNLALQLRQLGPHWEIHCLDNLERQGSEINRKMLEENKFNFIDSPVAQLNSEVVTRKLPDRLDAVIHAAAFCSVESGLYGGEDQFWGTNLNGTLECAQLAVKKNAQLIFLSTSRVYSIKELAQIPLTRKDNRLELDWVTRMPPGVTPLGLDETFSVKSPRSFYGTSKLASELILGEYAASKGLRMVINRLGVVAGPWQWGKPEQGVFSHWLASHYFARPLCYTGFGGLGLQVRDILHPKDLALLIFHQLNYPGLYAGEVFNVGGGHQNSCSLFEWTELCRKVTGHAIEVDSSSTTGPFDVPFFIADTSKVMGIFPGKFCMSLPLLANDLKEWMDQHREQVHFGYFRGKI